MIIKSFTAESAAAALKKVREGMGGDAIVLKTTRIPGAGTSTLVEVTACLEKPSVGQASIALSSDQENLTTARLTDNVAEQAQTIPVITSEQEGNRLDSRLARVEQKLDQLIMRTTLADSTQSVKPHLQPALDLLNKADLPVDFINDLLTNDDLTSISEENVLSTVRQMLVDKFAELMVPALSLTDKDSVIFIGPPGSGKSSVMGKLATQLVVQEKKKITLAGLEFHKVGAHDELAGYADLLEVPVVDDIAGSKKSKTIQLIDCPSLPYDNIAAERLIEAVDKAKATYRIAVFSSLMHLDDITATAEHLRALNPTHVVLTMTDLTDRRGNIIAAVKACDAKLVFVSDSVGGRGSLKTPDPDQIVRQILRIGIEHE